MAAIDEVELTRLRQLITDPKLLNELAHDVNEWSDAYAAYLIGCPFVDLAQGGLFKRFQRDYIGEVKDTAQLGLLLKERHREKHRKGTVGGHVDRLGDSAGGQDEFCAVTVMTDERMFVFEHPHHRTA